MNNFFGILELGMIIINASFSVHMSSQWSKNGWKVSWSYELWIALFGYGAIFPMENSVLKILQLEDIISH